MQWANTDCTKQDYTMLPGSDKPNAIARFLLLRLHLFADLFCFTEDAH